MLSSARRANIWVYKAPTAQTKGTSFCPNSHGFKLRIVHQNRLISQENHNKRVARGSSH